MSLKMYIHLKQIALLWGGVSDFSWYLLRCYKSAKETDCQRRQTCYHMQRESSKNVPMPLEMHHLYKPLNMNMTHFHVKNTICELEMKKKPVYFLQTIKIKQRKGFLKLEWRQISLKQQYIKVKPCDSAVTYSLFHSFWGGGSMGKKLSNQN